MVKIILEDYQTGWVDAFDAERQAITLALIDFSPIVEHIGSTAVPGLCAKPTLDILVGLRDDLLLDKVVAPMIAAGYTHFKLKPWHAPPWQRARRSTRITIPPMHICWRRVSRRTLQCNKHYETRLRIPKLQPAVDRIWGDWMMAWSRSTESPNVASRRQFAHSRLASVDGIRGRHAHFTATGYCQPPSPGL